MRLSGVLVLLVLSVALAACGDGGDLSRDELVRAADATRDAGGARVVEHGVLVFGVDRAYRFAGRGLRDARGSTDITRRYAAHRGPPLSPQTVRNIKIGDTTYVSSPATALPGKPWSRIDLGESSNRAADAGVSNPADSGAIARLLDSDDVRQVGHARVRGIATTHYAATIDMRDYAPPLVSPDAAGAVRDAYRRASQQGGGGSLRVDLWIDGQNLIRRVRQRESLRLIGFDYPPSDHTIELFDFGLEDQVKAPPQRDTETLGPAQSN